MSAPSSVQGPAQPENRVAVRTVRRGEPCMTRGLLPLRRFPRRQPEACPQPQGAESALDTSAQAGGPGEREMARKKVQKRDGGFSNQ